MKSVYGFLKYSKTRIYGFVSNCERVTLLLRRFTLLDTLLEIASAIPKKHSYFATTKLSWIAEMEEHVFLRNTESKALKIQTSSLSVDALKLDKRHSS